jgi:hypothetical protein
MRFDGLRLSAREVCGIDTARMRNIVALRICAWVQQEVPEEKLSVVDRAAASSM